MILPAHYAARLPRQTGETETDEPGEAALDGDVAAGFVYDVHVLMEPDRNVGVQPQEKAMGDPGLWLRERAGTGIEETAKPLPPPGKVAIQIDPVRVTADSRRGAVWVQIGNDPEVGLAQPRGMREQLRDGNPRAFVAVNAADHGVFAGLSQSPVSSTVIGRPSIERPSVKLRRPTESAERAALAAATLTITTDASTSKQPTRSLTT